MQDQGEVQYHMTGGELYTCRYTKKGIMSVMSMDMCMHARAGRPMVLHVTLVKMLEICYGCVCVCVCVCVCTKCIVK